MLKEEKQQVVEELAARLGQATTLLVADYRGLTMPEIEKVRAELLQHGARFTVCKNTLTRRAAAAAGVDALDELLVGPTAIAFVTDGDMAAVAKVLADTARSTRKLRLKGGVLSGRPIDAGAVEELASLPPLDVLRGQVLGAVVAPLTSLLGLVSAPLTDLVGLVDARVEQLGGPGAAPAAPDAAGGAGAAAEESRADATSEASTEPEAGEAAAPPSDEPEADEPATDDQPPVDDAAGVEQDAPAEDEE
jgi:large subunit ribosomal protein L10